MIAAPNFSQPESEFVYNAMVAAAREALDAGYLVLLDATFGNKRRRDVVVDALRDHFVKVDFVHVICDPEIALQRNSTRPSDAVVPPDTVRSMLSSFEPPDGAIVVDSSSVPPEEAAGRIVRTLYPLVPPE
jgi:predicted kinase